MNRRRFLSTTGQAALGATPIPFAASAQTGNLAHRLAAGIRSLAVQGRAATVFGITDHLGRSGLTLDVHDGFDVRLVSDVAVPPTLQRTVSRSTDDAVCHTSGLVYTVAADGVNLSAMILMWRSMPLSRAGIDGPVQQGFIDLSPAKAGARRTFACVSGC